MCVIFPFILDIKFVGRTSRGHTGGRSHRISHPPSFCGACLNFSSEKDSAIPFPRRPRSRILSPVGAFLFLFFRFLVRKIPFAGIELTSQRVRGLRGTSEHRGDTRHMYVENFKALHGRLAGRFKPPLAGRCNDFAPSRQKNCHRQKTTVPSRPSKKKQNTAPSRPVEKKKKSHPVPPRKKKKTAPSRLGKTNKPPRPASKKKQTAPSRHEQQNTPPRGWKLETNTTACLFFSLSCCTFISYCSLVRSIF